MNDSSILSVNTDFVNKLEKSFPEVRFKRIKIIEGLYITNELSKSLRNDLRIFSETQVKRYLRTSCIVNEQLKKKLAYFSQQEDEFEGGIYKCDKSQDLNSEEYAIHFIGHASLLIQIPDFNILTDPVFGSLSSTFYPEKTYSYPNLEELPQVNIILISHNHRDHLDEKTMRSILQHYVNKSWSPPNVLVPLGDKALLKSFGFESVEEVDWFSKVTVSRTDSHVDIISIPSDHRSGRGVVDHHKSLVTGWIINPGNVNIIMKFSGDTRPLTDDCQQAVDAVLWNEVKTKMVIHSGTLTDIICIEPDGPNYTRKDMDITHQSTSYSLLLKFKEAINFSKFSGMGLEVILPKILTVMIHRNKFELGPDRFNEGLFIFKKLYSYLNLSEEELENEFLKQQQKVDGKYDWNRLQKCIPWVLRPLLLLLADETTLIVHPKDFIIQDLVRTSQILKEFKVENPSLFIKKFLETNTTFPKIGERLNGLQLRQFCDVTSINKYNNKKRG